MGRTSSTHDEEMIVTMYSENYYKYKIKLRIKEYGNVVFARVYAALFRQEFTLQNWGAACTRN
jgi:hypothetical protein